MGYRHFLILTCILIVCTLAHLFLQRRRHAQVFLDDLLDQQRETVVNDIPRKRRSSRPTTSATLRPVPIGLLCGLVAGFTDAPLVFSFLAFLTGMAGSYLFSKWHKRNAERRELEELDRMVPVVMERLVMAAQAGLDVTASIQSILDIEEYTTAHTDKDPVTRLLQQVLHRAERGAGFTRALQSVAEEVPSIAVRHAFIHLAVAHDEGGEIVRPLRELSDSAQIFYQENLEEYISRLPVQATMPLLCTFAGLILFFLTTPLIQVIELLANVKLPG